MKPLEKLTKKELIEIIRMMERNFVENPQNQFRHIYASTDIMEEVRREFWDAYGIDHEK